MHRKWMLEDSTATADQTACHLMQLDSGGFVKYLKHWSGVNAEECPIPDVGQVYLVDLGVWVASVKLEHAGRGLGTWRGTFQGGVCSKVLSGSSLRGFLRGDSSKRQRWPF
jgi:hypothetical protein